MRLSKSDLPQFKSPAAFCLGTRGEEQDCKCGHYAVPDWQGYCSQEECRKTRLAHALRTGAAVRLANGTILWQVE